MPAFATLPQPLAGQTARLLQRYLQRSKALGQEPDETLLTPIIEVFQRLRGDTPKEDTA
jgi:hypothetical protein